MGRKNGTSYKKTSVQNHLHPASEDPSNSKQIDPTPLPVHSAPSPLDPSNNTQPISTESLPPSEPTPPPYRTQDCPIPTSAPPSTVESLLKYQSALKEANLVASESKPLEPDVVKISTNKGGPRTQNAQQIVMEKLKMAAEHRKQLELALSNQKKEIESCTIPFLQELIEGEDGGAHVTNNAIDVVSHFPQGPECRDKNDPTRDMSIPQIANTPLETEDGGDTTPHPTKPPEKIFDNTDGEMGPTIPPSDQLQENGHGTRLGLKSDEIVTSSNEGDNSFSPNLRTFDFGNNNGGEDLADWTSTIIHTSPEKLLISRLLPEYILQVPHRLYQVTYV
ncbi:hypothetical protein SUGI_1103230 [Cryptomeria japonica]|nr:hypothetical protein SUGI_1103230 [Cryptomeria japonica]